MGNSWGINFPRIIYVSDRTTISGLISCRISDYNIIFIELIGDLTINFVMIAHVKVTFGILF